MQDSERLLLHPAHLAKLESSGISLEVALARGYESIILGTTLKAEGYSPRQYNLVPGLRIPLWNVLGGQSTSQFRPDKPRFRGKDGKPIKYETPPHTRPIIDVNPMITLKLQDPSITLGIAEGSLKADAGISHGLTVVSLSGVWNWKAQNDFGGTTALGDWDSIPLKDRTVIIVFDSDSWSKPQVYLAVSRLASFLTSRGARVGFAILPDAPNGDKQGLDDYLLTHTVNDLQQTVVFHIPDAPQSWDRATPINGYRSTDLGNSERFRDTYNGSVRYIHDWKHWLVWGNTHWLRDRVLSVEELAKNIPRAIFMEAQNTNDNKQSKELAQHAVRSSSTTKIQAFLTLARSDPAIRDSPDRYDKKPFLLNFSNGTLDLTTAELYPNDIDDNLTQIIPYNYIAPNITTNKPILNIHPDWQAFLNLITGNDEETITYLQRVCGYCMTGSQKEGSLFLALGPTRTGKSTFLRVLMTALGDYAIKTKFDTFLSTRRSGGPRPEIAEMENIRLVLASEANEGQRFDEAVIKELTASDPVRERHLYQANRQFIPQLKIFLASNTMPYVRSDDTGTWSRLKITNFNNPEVANRQHLDLKIRLQDATNTALYESIIQWMVQGAYDWLDDDSLAIPQSTINATAARQRDMQPLNEWMEECIERTDDPNDMVTAADLWLSYTVFYERDRSHRNLTQTGFGKALAALGLERKHTSQGNVYYGLRVMRW